MEYQELDLLHPWPPITSCIKQLKSFFFNKKRNNGFQEKVYWTIIPERQETNEMSPTVALTHYAERVPRVWTREGKGGKAW